MKAFFNELFEYNRHMNNELIRSIVQNRSTVSEKSLKWINHILNAHELFNCRIEPAGYEPPAPWDMRALEELAPINENNFQVSLGILRLYDFDTVIMYTTMKGTQMENTVGDIMFHMINHSTYHRGQIAVEFRNGGLEPLVGDWVVYKRKVN
jgi:uncharacterized damage-inducible protein DinB